MKTWFRNIMAFSLLFVYSLSISIPIQNFIVDSVLNIEQHHDVSVNHSNYKTPELSIFPNLEPFGSVLTDNVLSFQIANLKAHLPFFKYAETYTLTKDNQYLYNSKNIQPGLDIETLLYPFHTFS